MRPEGCSATASALTGPRKHLDPMRRRHHYHIITRHHQHPSPLQPGTLIFYLTKLARLGGYLARAADPPPGNMVVWRGLSRLTDIKLGAEIAGVQTVGN